MSDLDAFAKLVGALSPWQEDLVFIGGWAHRLYRHHHLAEQPNHRPLLTRDADVAFADGARLEGNIRTALLDAGFREQLSGRHRPPVSQYTLGDENAGFYAEFLTPLHGSGLRRNGAMDATTKAAGITAQKLRHLELLLIQPWQVTVGPDQDFARPAHLKVANPVAFIVQKLLIHEDRPPHKRAQDVLYIHDTFALFGARFPALNALWLQHLQPTLTPRQARSVTQCTQTHFHTVTDTFRSAARIPQDRTLDPGRMQAFCALALEEILAGRS
ncbi:hypothetical protein H2514_09305 [Lysobacter sp. CW239]|uniref:GSU2403 family nucleotidyltransferase fold protein n=1 Tax=Lysobacteraceae TaxID=32033 RepID=UPI00068F4697|nr:MULTISPECIES: GSU2403 family nucleotidyltransferase fold protein [Lysobacter]QOD90409.1 hypothetical protein H2514_09305 [Lysobacter sp. CW239]